MKEKKMNVIVTKKNLINLNEINTNLSIQKFIFKNSTQIIKEIKLKSLNKKLNFSKKEIKQYLNG